MNLINPQNPNKYHPVEKDHLVELIAMRFKLKMNQMQATEAFFVCSPKPKLLEDYKKKIAEQIADLEAKPNT